jgi:hypothetical protein
MARIRDAESGLVERVEDLQGFLRDCDRLAGDWESHDSRMARLLGAEGDFPPPR